MEHVASRATVHVRDASTRETLRALPGTCDKSSTERPFLALILFSQEFLSTGLGIDAAFSTLPPHPPDQERESGTVHGASTQSGS